MDTDTPMFMWVDENTFCDPSIDDEDEDMLMEYPTMATGVGNDPRYERKRQRVHESKRGLKRKRASSFSGSTRSCIMSPRSIPMAHDSVRSPSSIPMANGSVRSPSSIPMFHDSTITMASDCECKTNNGTNDDTLSSFHSDLARPPKVQRTSETSAQLGKGKSTGSWHLALMTTLNPIEQTHHHPYRPTATTSNNVSEQTTGVRILCKESWGWMVSLQTDCIIQGTKHTKGTKFWARWTGNLDHTLQLPVVRPIHPC